MRVYALLDCVKEDYVSVGTSNRQVFETPVEVMSLVHKLTASGKRKKEEFRIDEFEMVLSFMGIILNSDGDVVWQSA